MLYSLLKLLMQIAVRIFFRSVTIRNKELIPKNGPLLVLANHPSTFMDPIVIASLLKRQVYFLAKGELFKGSFLTWFFTTLNMIPVYRKQDDPSQMNKNKDTFVKCFEHLENGGAILMFPEGTSITERKLRPIKTGAARIVLGAEARNDFKLGIQIFNIGLNYVNPHKFNHDLFVNIDTPIPVSDYKDVYILDTFKGASNLTEEIRVRLEKLIIAIEDDKINELVNNVETLYKYKLSKDTGVDKKDKSQDFILTKNIIETVHYFSIHKPQMVEDIRLQIVNYFRRINAINITDTVLVKSSESKTFLRSSFNSLFTIVIGFPFYLYGLVNNYLPFEIPGWIANKVAKSIEFRGAIGMVGGVFTFLFFYTLQIILCWKFTHIKWLTVGCALSLPLSGIFGYWYYYWVDKIRTKWLLLSLFYKKSVFISSLINEREQIISAFDTAKKEYVEALKSKQNGDVTKLI